jgi:hypothetical protein
MARIHPGPATSTLFRFIALAATTSKLLLFGPPSTQEKSGIGRLSAPTWLVVRESSSGDALVRKLGSWRLRPHQTSSSPGERINRLRRH